MPDQPDQPDRPDPLDQPDQPGRPPDVRRLEPAEREKALTSTVAAFATDPLLRWVWPSDDRYRACAPGFFGLLLDLRRAGGEVWAVDGGAAVAMWDPPGGLYATPPADPWPPLQESFEPRERECWATYERQVGEREDAPHWYLGVLATDPARQGGGLAAAVVAPVLAACDRTGVPAWLETASAGNVAYYARFGFLPVREVDLPDGGPQCWLLRREPRSTAREGTT
ncbi:MAG TPA: GNAT family N-acetyltransferase [Actinomycetes bacterium]|nr:GNAT family N-acetyltransferase [Actinomycetes bacterium]